jgi:cytochrome c-type biogenesis protein CcmH
MAWDHVRKLPILAAAAFAALALFALGPPPNAHAQDYIELDGELEARASSLYVGLMCPQCSGQTISQSHAAIAETMRIMVREGLANGDTDAEIYAFMVGAFGESVLAEPPKSGVTLAVWLIPPIGLALGAMAVFMAIRRLRRNGGARWRPAAAGARGDSPPAGLEGYLRLVDEEMSDGPTNAGSDEGRGG